MYWVMGFLPFALLLLGFPIFLLLLITSLVVLLFFFDVPMTVVAQIIYNSLDKYAFSPFRSLFSPAALCPVAASRYVCCGGSRP